jgi:hypothetical protein
VISVSYYHSISEDLYAAALRSYDDNVGSSLGKIRAEISKALRLTSAETYQKLISLYYDGFIRLDQDLRGLVMGNSNNWHAHNQYAVFELSEKIDDTLNNLAAELQLKGKN